MLAQTEAMIYLATQRGCSQAYAHLSYHTLNFRDYYDESRKPIGNLLAVNHDWLSSGKTVAHRSKGDAAILLLPLVGALHYKTTDHRHGTLDVGQALLIDLDTSSEIEVTNSYRDESINFMHFWFLRDLQRTLHPAAESIDFDLDANKNKLLGLNFSSRSNGPQNPILIGQFDGRHEGRYLLKHSRKGIFAYVLAGVFEVQNRLLEPHDGLALWEIDEVEFEALSNDAIILVVELL